MNTTHTTPTAWPSRRTEWLILAVILLAAAFLRLYRLDAIPPGLTHDEAGHSHDAVAILHGARPIYETVGYGREPLYDYVAAGLMTLIGPIPLALRLVSVTLGLLTLLVTFAWARLAFDSPTALAAVALQAASFWSLTTSRQTLRSTLLPMLFTAAIYFYRRWACGPTSTTASELPRRAGRWQIGLVALLIGATLYTYLPARVMWIVFPTFLVYLAFAHRPTFRRVWLSTLVAVLIGLLLSAPMFIWLQQHPGAEERLAMLDAPLEALRTGDVSGTLNRAWSGVSAFFIPGRGDDFLAYTIPGRPFFDPLTGALFLAGLVLCLARWRGPSYTFTLIWFLIGISPTLITGAPASITRSIAAMPVAFIFPALAVVMGVRWLATRWNRWAARGVSLGFAILVAIIGAISARDYVFTWGESPDVRAAYQHTLVETARYLDTQPEGGTVALSTVYPQAPHDPYVFEMSLRRRDLSTRWFDARTALLIPAESTARLIVPFSTPLDALGKASNGDAAYSGELPGLHIRERVTLRPDDLDPFFVVYDWEPQTTLAALQEQARGVPLELALPVNLGNAVQFIGYNLSTPMVAPGGTVKLLTLWKVTNPQALQNSPNSNAALVLFTHALNKAEAVVGQEDRLDAPAWDWQAGDVIAQLHRFTLPPGFPAGLVSLEVGAYRPAGLTRLPVLVNNVIVGDRILLRPVEVR
jgi:hypothetical protein